VFGVVLVRLLESQKDNGIMTLFVGSPAKCRPI
jgi:hypothetical protein